MTHLMHHDEPRIGLLGERVPRAAAVELNCLAGSIFADHVHIDILVLCFHAQEN